MAKAKKPPPTKFEVTPCSFPATCVWTGGPPSTGQKITGLDQQYAFRNQDKAAAFVTVYIPADRVPKGLKVGAKVKISTDKQGYWRADK